MRLRYKSEPKPWSGNAGAFVRFTEFVEQRGPRGGRVVIDALTAVFVGQIDVAVAVLPGEDTARAFRTVDVLQKDGVSRYTGVPGDALRIFGFAHNGPSRQKEHADCAIANNQAVTWSMRIPLAKRYAKRGRDFSMAADAFQEIKIGCASAAELGVNGATVTIDSGEYYVIAECHEEMDIIQHSVDEVFVSEFDATTSTKIAVDGRLHDVLLYVRGGNGGADLANLSEAFVEYLQPQSMLVKPDLQENYAESRDIVTGLDSTQGAALRSDPFITSTTRACAVLLTDGNKVFDGPVRDNVNIKTVQSAPLADSLQAICRVVRPRGERLAAAMSRKYGFAATRPKTADKTQPKIPGEFADYLPAKALKSAPAARRR